MITTPILSYYLILNRVCNFNCIYCVESAPKESSLLTRPPAEKVASYFPETGDYLIKFYGGEPLFDFDYMVDIIYAIRTRNPNVKFRVTTNGSLLTVHKAEILNKLNVEVKVSHDGLFYEKTRRRPDILKTNPDPILAIDNLTFAATVTSYNWNFYDHIWGYFEEWFIKHNHPRVKVGTLFLKDICGNVDPSLFVYNNENFESMLDKVFANLKSNILTGTTDSYEYMNYAQLFGKYLSSIERGTNTTLCMYGDVTGAIDVYGNTYTCHNCLQPAGHVTTTGFPQVTSPPIVSSEPCASCSVREFCCGGCPLVVPDKFKYVCYYIKNEYTRLKLMLDDVVNVLNDARGGIDDKDKK